MTNSTPWQTLINANNTTNVLRSESNLVIIKKSAAFGKSAVKPAVVQTAVPKRYSFDDNGGGYLGL